VEPPLEDLAVEDPRTLKDNPRSRFQLLAWMHEGFPRVASGVANKQTLHGAAARHTPAEEPRRNDARVVDDEHIARFEKLRECGDDFMAHRAACTIEEKHPRGISLGRGFLRD
jgi:hypothetical protein